ncbi:MAG: LLM class flavin-dependent oxidoreductase [Chloroflexota bacterium]|nr:LLM class flavin-dependent oxidoreductase [Chloroflexota bacterium]
MQFGVQLLPQEVSWPEWRDSWLRIDALGFDSNWSFDHVHAPRGKPDSDSFEGWVGMGALAALTRNAGTGMLVSPVTFRNPALMVKMATTLDHITGGKSIYGLGAGWHVNEHQAYGFGWPSAGERVSRLAEALEITHRMWNRDAQPASFSGRFYQLDQAFNNPAPLQSPHPPILVAGSGPRIIGLVARYADVYDSWPPLDALQQRFRLLAEACAGVNRSYDTITRSLSVDYLWAPDPSTRESQFDDAVNATPGRDPATLRARILGGGPAELIEQIRTYQAAGVQQIILHIPSPYDMQGLQHFAQEVLPAFR